MEIEWTGNLGAANPGCANCFPALIAALLESQFARGMMDFLNVFRDALDTTILSVRSALSEAPHTHEQPAYRSAALRKALLRQYQTTPHPRVPRPFVPTQSTPILSLVLYRTVVDSGGLTRLPRGTQLLMAAICIPYIAPEGVSMMKWGLSPFMVWV